MALKNPYHRRQVAEASAKACWICYKPSSTVLITPANDDWFHVCPGHLVDRKFAIPQDVVDPAEKAREEALANEIEAVKAEYAAKLKKRADIKTKRDKDKSKDKKEADKQDRAEEQANEADQKEKVEKVKVLEEKKGEVKNDSGPRIFDLQKSFLQMRIDRKRNVEMAKRSRERLKAPGAFPAVPSGNP